MEIIKGNDKSNICNYVDLMKNVSYNFIPIVIKIVSNNYSKKKIF